MQYYFKKQQMRRYDQDWEERLYKTLMELDPKLDCEEMSTKKRIKPLRKIGIKLKVYKKLTVKQAQKKKEEEMEKKIKRRTKNMGPIEAYRYRDNFLKEQNEEKDQPDLMNDFTNILLDIHLKEEKEEIDKGKSMVWENFKKEGKRIGIYDMKKKVRKWLGREKSDIRERIEAKRIKITRKLKQHQRLLKEVEYIKERNERDARFMPKLEEAIEKNRDMKMLDYKNHTNKILGNKMRTRRET
jgi:hypothetical protein